MKNELCPSYSLKMMVNWLKDVGNIILYGTVWTVRTGGGVFCSYFASCWKNPNDTVVVKYLLDPTSHANT